jgi:hypothetical protein
MRLVLGYQKIALHTCMCLNCQIKFCQFEVSSMENLKGGWKQLGKVFCATLDFLSISRIATFLSFLSFEP